MKANAGTDRMALSPRTLLSQVVRSRGTHVRLSLPHLGLWLRRRPPVGVAVDEE